MPTKRTPPKKGYISAGARDPVKKIKPRATPADGVDWVDRNGNLHDRETGRFKKKTPRTIDVFSLSPGGRSDADEEEFFPELHELAAIEARLETLERRAIAGASWRDFGAVIVVDSLENAMPLVNRIAAEHLELAVEAPEELAERISHAGAIFLGRHTPEAIGDYVGGSNHVLPTARSARFSSGLSVLDFVKRTSILKCDADSLRALGPAAITLGEAEGLSGHARSVAIRLNL